MDNANNPLAALGIDKIVNEAGSYQANNDFYASGKATPKAKGPGFIKDVVNTAKAIPGAVGGFLANAFTQPISHFVSSTSSALQSGQFNANQNSMRQNLDKQIKVLSNKYASTDPKQKISKQDYQNGIRLIQKQYEGLNTEAQAYGQQVGTPGEAVKSAAETLAIPLAFGTLGAGAAGASALEQAASKVPALGVALAKPVAEQTAGTAVKALAKGAVKFPLITKPVVDTGGQVATDLKHGNVLGAAGNAALLATGVAKGPISFVKGVASKVGNVANKAVMGEESLFKGIKTKEGNLLGYVQSLADKAAKGSSRAAEDLKIAKIYQQYKLDETGGNVNSAVRELTEHYKNRPTEALSGKEVFTDFKKFVQSSLKVKEADIAGKIPRGPGSEGLSARVGRFGAEEAGKLKESLTGVQDAGERRAIAYNFLKDSEAGKNPILREDIMAAAERGNLDTKRLTSLTSQAKVAGLSRGYFPILTKARADFKPIGEVGQSIKETKPIIPGLRGVLRSAGVSPESADPTVFTRIQKDAVNKIDKLGIDSINGSEHASGSIGSQVTNGLEEMLKHRKGASDVRQLKINEIATDLGVTGEQARAIRNAIHDAHFAVSLGERGLAQRIQDINLKFNPLAAGYSRIQGALKYEANPFFRAQESIETELLGQGASGGNTKLLQRILGHADPQKTLQQMREAGLLRGGEFGSSGAASNQGAFVSSKLGTFQQRSLAGTVEAMAENRGITVPKLLEDNAVRDQIRSIVQYPEKGIFSSNAARALNLIAFPVSYNFKVAKLATDALAKTGPLTQIATVKGLTGFNDWLDTDAGIKWSSKNSEALGLLNYFSPANSIESVVKILSGKASSSDFGQLGGLPFGVISQILQDHGLYHTDQPYQDPKTGQVVPKNIPQDATASAATMLTDLISSLYNFPGRTAGFTTSKSDLTKAIPGVSDLTKAGTYSPQVRTDLTPKGQRKQELLSPVKAKQEATLPGNVANRIKFNTPSGSVVHVVPSPGKIRTKKAKVFARPIQS